MSKNIQPLTEESIIEIGGSISPGQYSEFFSRVLGDKYNPKDDIYFWMNAQTGKTLKEAVEMYGKPIEPKKMGDILSEKRFDVLSKSNKDFIISFDKEIEKLGYDFGGYIGRGTSGSKYMIVYSKTAGRTKKVVARIFFGDNNEVVLKLIIKNVEKHSAYIETAPGHIKDVFAGGSGDCKKCASKNGNCKMVKRYTVGGKQIEKCSERVFRFLNPDIEKFPDYINLLAEFNPVKKAASTV
jgi:hypothetical protein